MVDGGWGPIGLGAITDIVKHVHGPVDLDRSPVRLGPVAVKRPGCPACAGEQFGFIAGLAEAQERMCAAHHKEAVNVQRKRLVRAEVSNPDGCISDIRSHVTVEDYRSSSQGIRDVGLVLTGAAGHVSAAQQALQLATGS